MGDLDNLASTNPDYAKAWLDQFAGEYSIVQDKIDKIASVRFTIRGWSVTLVVALAFGANTLKLPPYWLLSALIPVVAFSLMERSQERYGDILGARAIRIEKRIWRLLRQNTPAESDEGIGGMVPRLAHDLGEANQLASPVPRTLRAYGYWLFYGLQIVLVLVAAIWLNEFQRRLPLSEEQPAQVIINNSGPSQADERSDLKGGSQSQVK